MRFGSQSNQAPGLPAASPAYPEALPSESSAACFRQAAAAEIPVLLRFPALHQPPERPGLSIPAPNQSKLRAVRDRCPRHPAPLRARSDKQPARRFAASGPPRKQNRDPALRPHPAAAPRTPAKPLSPELPRVRRCAPRNTPLPFGCSNLFFLGDHDSRSGPFIRGKFGGDRKAASPCKNAATRQHRPAITLPSTDALLVQQALQLVGALVTPGTQSVTGTPIAQHQRKEQSVPVENRPISTSFRSLEGPVNHLEAEYAPQFRNAHFRLASRQIDLVLILPRGSMRTCLFRPVHSEKEKFISFSSYFYSPRKSQRTAALPAARPLESRFNVVSRRSARARFDTRDHVAHHPPADAGRQDGNTVVLAIFL